MPGLGGVPGAGRVGAWSGGGGGVWPQGVPGGDPSPTATAAGGTHPTGMFSCLVNNFTSICVSFKVPVCSFC